ncbi:MAG: hypothetical protein A4E64_00936 [Syntrophorhabdus sp. PtaU1.Bin058]|nr:MAG: hypothetical protein A4E64_00936 [Syntrophorhabdus sp. PtaU1.Bin058]
MSTSKFQQRFIAFVDILGFTNIVRRMSEESRLFVTIRDSLKSLDLQSRRFQEYRRRLQDKRKQIIQKGLVPLLPNITDLQMTAFSDCYVISEITPAWHVLAAIQTLGANLLKEGILTRGAVVYGDAYHKGRVLFGPGIVEAYKLESEVAKYPRILVTDSVRQTVWGYHNGLCKGRLLKQDIDGCWFVNVLTPPLSSWAAVSDKTNDRNARLFLQKIRQSLTTELRRERENLSHLSKVRWLVHRFNEEATAEGVRTITGDKGALLKC